MSTEVEWFKAGPNPGDIQAAINAATAAGGGVVYIPAKSTPYTLDAANQTLVIPYEPLPNLYTPVRPLIILGDGPEATRIAKASSLTFDLLIIQRSYVTVEGITFDGGGSSSSGRGIVLASAAAGAGDPLRRVRLINCIVRGTGSHALHVRAVQAGATMPSSAATWTVSLQRTARGLSKALWHPWFASMVSPRIRNSSDVAS
jgi:hypothetical protein